MSLQKASLISSAVTFFGSICLSSEFERLSSLVWVLSERFCNHLIILTKGAATSGTQPPAQEQDSSQPLPGLPWLDPPRTILRGRAESRTWSSNSPRPWKSSGDQWWLICWEKLMYRDAMSLVQHPFLNSGTWHSLASLFHFMSFRQWHLPWGKNMKIWRRSCQKLSHHLRWWLVSVGCAHHVDVLKWAVARWGGVRCCVWCCVNHIFKGTSLLSWDEIFGHF